MNRFLVTGYFSPEKQDFVFRKAGLESLNPSSYKNFLIVVPNRRFGTLLERSLLRSPEKNGLVLPQIKTIDDVWLSVIRETNPDLQFETRWQRMLLIRKVLSGPCADLIRNEPPDGWLDYYHRSIQFFESVMDENFKLPETILENLGSDTGFFEKFDLFYQEYQKLATGLGLISRERLRFFLPDQTNYFSGFKSVLFLSIDEWIEDHWKFLVKNVASPETVVFSVEVKDPTDSSQPFSVIYSSVFSGGWELTRFQQPEPVKKQDLFRFDSVQNELEFIAGSIRKDISAKREVPLNLHDICVVLRDRNRYLPWLQMIFKEYGIPFNLSAGFPVSQSVIVRFIRIILDLSSGSVRYKELQNFFLHPFINDDLTFRQIEMVFRQTGDHQSVNEWLLNLDEKNNSQDSKVLRIAVERVGSLKTKLAQLNSCSTLEDWSRFLNFWVHSVLSGNRVTDRNILDFASWTAYQKVTQVLTEISGWKSGSLKLSSSDFRFLLNLILDSMTWNEPVRNGVQILGPLEVKGYRFSSLYFTGLEQHVYPSSDKENMMFPAALVKNIDQFYFMNLRYREWAEFETILGNPTDQLILSFPADSSEENPEPSPFVSLAGFSVKSDQADFGIQIPRKQFTTDQKSGDDLPLFIQEKTAWFHHADRLNGPSLFDGIVTSDHGKSVWKELVDSKFSSLSASSIDLFSQCGQRFFYERVLHLEEDEVFQEEVDPRDKGTLLHAILQEFIQKKQMGSSVNDWELMVSIVDEKTPDILDLKRFLPSKFAEKLKNKAISPLAGFLATQNELEKTLTPRFAEWGFGLKDSQFPALTFDGPGIRTFTFSGKIDRLDQHQNGRTVFYDYKAGDQDHIKKMTDAGRSFQLYIYHEATTRFKPLGSDVDWMAYFVLTRPGETPQSRLKPFFGTIDQLKGMFPKAGRRGDPFKENADFVSYLSASREKLISQLKSVENGEFFHNKTAWRESEKGFQCSDYCPFLGFCRKDEARIKNLHDQHGGSNED
ncbi:MAG: PD-(D/E)XK nuclease family protein [Bacteroidetes bacterium]|nr:PD-(D/E)XK nuclease family protein [Bacteroidota bacterium]